MKIKYLSGLTLLILPLAVGGCTGSGSTASTTTANVSANGFWTGTFQDVGGATNQVTALLDGGRIIAISQSAGTLYDGSYTTSGNNFSGNVAIYPINGSQFATATLSGTVTAQSAVTLGYTTSTGTTGTMTVSYDGLYDRVPSLALTAANWAYTGTASTASLAVLADGSYTGTDSSGCIYSGNLTIPDPAHNLYGTTTTISGCGASNGNYTGFASLVDTTVTNDTLMFAISNGSLDITYSFIRQ